MRNDPRVEVLPIAGAGLLALAAALTACGITDTACTGHPQPAVDVLVRRADDGEPVEGALVVVRDDGAFADSAVTDPDGRPARFLAPNRAGVYRVSVEKDGFEPWVRTGVEVGLNDCGQARTRSLEAILAPRS